ncbi:ISAzo13 family transposase, partial [candidate division KSB1 bacterium]|nr:ISAzo13 family transposase [candidate division KSB1 bacterium]
KTISTGSNPDRDKQFGIIKVFREQFNKTGDPVISVDTKKKELIGLFKNPGRTWCL